MGRHGNVQVARRRIPEQPLQPDLPAGGVHEIDAANDFRNALLVVVHDDREVIGNESIAAPHHEIAGFGFESFLVGALQAIDESERRVVGTHSCRGFACRAAAAARARVDDAERAAGRVRKVPAGAAAGVGMPRLEQPRQRRRMGGMAGALVDDGAVPFEAVALQGLQNARCGGGLLPGRIDILDAQQPAAAAVASLQIAGSRGEQ